MFRYIAVASLCATSALCEPVVVTDIPVVHSLAAQVMAGVADPTLLVDKGGDPHNYQLRPSQARALTNADVVFWVGPELTPWLEQALEHRPDDAASIALLWASDTKRIEYEGEHDHHEEDGDHEEHHDDHEEDGHEKHDGHDDHDTHEEHGEHDDHDDHDDHKAEAHDDHEGDEDHHHHHSGTDPHAWLNPENASAWVTEIEARLSEIDPENAALYAQNAQNTRAKLEALHSEMRAQLADHKTTQLFVFHDAYGYFAETFDLMPQPLADGDATPPSARQISALRDKVQQTPRACVFAEAGHSDDYAKLLTEGTEITPGTLDPAGRALTPGPDLYEALIRSLADEIAGCLPG